MFVRGPNKYDSFGRVPASRKFQQSKNPGVVNPNDTVYFYSGVQKLLNWMEIRTASLSMSNCIGREIQPFGVPEVRNRNKK